MIKLKIAFADHKAGDQIELDKKVEKHFLAKGWAEEIEKKKGKK